MVVVLSAGFSSLKMGVNYSFIHDLLAQIGRAVDVLFPLFEELVNNSFTPVERSKVTIPCHGLLHLSLLLVALECV